MAKVCFVLFARFIFFRNKFSQIAIESIDFLFICDWCQMDGLSGSEELAVNRVQDENVDNSQGYVEIGRIENDDEVIIVQIENPNVPNPSDAVPHNRSPDDTNPLEQPPPAEVTSDEGILTPNRKKRKRFVLTFAIFCDRFSAMANSTISHKFYCFRMIFADHVRERWM